MLILTDNWWKVYNKSFLQRFTKGDKVFLTGEWIGTLDNTIGVVETPVMLGSIQPPISHALKTISSLLLSLTTCTIHSSETSWEWVATVSQNKGKCMLKWGSQLLIVFVRSPMEISYMVLSQDWNTFLESTTVQEPICLHLIQRCAYQPFGSTYACSSWQPPRVPRQRSPTVWANIVLVDRLHPLPLHGGK